MNFTMKQFVTCILLTICYPGEGVSLQTNCDLNHLGTRTPYRFIANKNDSKIKFPGCKDRKIWMVIRHGTRLPSPKDIIGMNSTLRDLKYDILMHHKYGKVDLTKEELESFKEWNSSISLESNKKLVQEGRDEMTLLAERMKKRFPNAIRKKYSNESFLFRYTPTERTQQSARYFANGLFEQKEAKDVIFAPTSAIETTLRFYKHCDKWQEQVKKNPVTYKEQKLFGISDLMNKTLESVSKRLGFATVLSLDQVGLMYKICGFETSWNKYSSSPWCVPFDKHDAEVLEYYFDLKAYWLDGYGHEFTYRQACMLIKNMFENFSKKDDPRAIFLFSHSGTLLKTISHLGLYKPETHFKADQLDKNREWKTTKIDCFAANLAFVLYECKDGDYVLTLHQENIIKLPMCETELCPYKHLKEFFKESIFNCNFNDMCSLKRDEL